MALAPKLEFRQSQQLVMTPQLQQAIKLLQLSNQELSEYVEQQLEENPFLERAEAGAGDAAPENASSAASTAGESNGSAQDDARADAQNAGGDAAQETSAESGAETGPRAEDALDADYNAADAGDAGYGEPPASAPPAEGESYTMNEWAGVGGGGRSGFDDDGAYGETLSSDLSLHDHLIEQLHVATVDSQQLFIGAYIIDLIDDAGYLREPVDAVAERLGAEDAEVEETLRLIQTFDPSGVGARDLKECLRLQLAERDRLDPTMDAFIGNIELLAKADLKGLIKATQADEEDVRDMIAEVRGLTPKPGYAYSSDVVQIVAPDVFVTKRQDGAWKVELNNATLPKILVNQQYYSMVSKDKRKDRDTAYVQEQFANASWLAKSLDQRARTILKVSEEIVRQQDAFLEYGVRHLRPLNLKAVADAIEMHESTISRVTSNKYVHTPRGLFELKYFFTASIASSEGGEAHSAESVRHRIKELIAAETADTVLSDDKIVETLRAEGVDIARRTVAKYRDTMGIASSVQRRRAAVRAAI